MSQAFPSGFTDAIDVFNNAAGVAMLFYAMVSTVTSRLDLEASLISLYRFVEPKDKDKLIALQAVGTGNVALPIPYRDGQGGGCGKRGRTHEALSSY